MRYTIGWLLAWVVLRLASGCEPLADEAVDSGVMDAAVSPDVDRFSDADGFMPDSEARDPVPDAAVPPDAVTPPDAAVPPDAVVPPDAALPIEQLKEVGPFCASLACPPEPDCADCADLIFVDAAAEAGGDGRRGTPLRNIGAP